MSQNIRSALNILADLRKGHTVTELSGALHDATAAVKEHGKPAKVVVEFTIKPFTESNLVDPPVTMTAKIITTLPQPVPESTLFFVDENGNLSNIAPVRQPELGLSVAGAKGA